MPTGPRNLGPDGKDADVSGEHLDQAIACLSTATARRDVDDVAQAIANAEARGFHAIDRPRGRELDHNTTAHQMADRYLLHGDAQRDELEVDVRAALADAYAAGRADQLAEQTPAALVLTVEQLAEVRDLFHAMPYGGSARPRRDMSRNGPADGVELVETLRGMQRVLQVVGRQQTEAYRELEELRGERSQARAYLGAGLVALIQQAAGGVTEVTPGAGSVDG